MKYSHVGSWLIAAFTALTLGATIYSQAHAPLTNDQQAITSSTTSVVVVLIPGFPIESILIGTIVGILVLMILRKRRLVHQRTKR